MVASNYKRKSPALLFAAGFLVIIGIMLIANHKSSLEWELKGPVDGIQKLYTVRDSLVAVSNGSEVYLWNWKELENKAKITSVAASDAVALPTDKLIWIPSHDPCTIIISNFEDARELKRLSIGAGWQCRHLSINRAGQPIIGLEAKGQTTQSSGSYERIRLETIQPDFDKLLSIATIGTKDENLFIYGLAISNGGTFIAVVGQKKDVGWIGIVDVSKKKLLWTKSIETSADLTEIAFSPDDEVCYVGGEGKYLYSFETASGKIASQLLIDEEQLMASFNEQRVTCTEVSPDGFMVAAGVNPGNKVYFWDTRTGKRLGVIGGCRGLNNLAFAPDSSTFVVAGRNYGGSLKVRRVPGK